MPAKKTKKDEWPADSVKRVSLAELVPYANNSRLHSPEQVKQIAEAMKEFGWTNPILVDEDNMIIAGHGRLQAALLLEHKTAPVMVARGWSDAQKRAYVIADNRLAELASWDMDVLVEEAQSLMDDDFDLDVIGVDEMFLGGDLDFEPTLEPVTAHKQITVKDVSKTAGKLAEGFSGGEDQELIAVMCPHCGEEFEVSGS